MTDPEAQAPAKAKRNGKPPAKKKKADPSPHARHGWIWVAIVGVALVSGGGLASLWFLEAATQQADSKRIEAQVRAELSGAVVQAAQTPLATIDQRLGEIEKKIASNADAPSPKDAEAALALLAEKIEGLSGRISELEKNTARFKAEAATGHSDQGTLDEARAEAKRSADEVASLKERLASLEDAQHAKPPAEAQRNQALVVAVGQLREALSVSKPFAAELAAVNALGDDGIKSVTAPIEPLASSGVATLRELREGFQSVASAVVQAGAAPQNGDWLDKAMAQAASVVTVRKVGPAEGSAPDAIIARAENRLGLDDLDGALGEMAALTGAPAAAAQDWMEKARARQAAEKALKELHLRAIGQIAQSDGPAK